MYASLDDLKLEMEVGGEDRSSAADTTVPPPTVSKDSSDATPEIGECLGLLIIVCLHAQ